MFAVDKEVSMNKKDLKKWTDYKESGNVKLDTQIKLLKQEIVAMDHHFELITGQNSSTK